MELAGLEPALTLGIHTTEFEITPERKKAIYDSGPTAAEKFLQTWDFSGYLRVPQR